MFVYANSSATLCCRINDRIVIANGFNLENADYATAVQIMKDSDVLNLVRKFVIQINLLTATIAYNNNTP